MPSIQPDIAPEAGGTFSVDHLYDSHNSWLINWLRRKTGCSFEAADLAQDTFVRLLVSGEAPTIREPRAWLATTARRLLIDRSRRRRLEQVYLAELAASVDLRVEVPSSEQVWMAIQTLDALALALERLPAKPRRAFVLRYIEGASTADIAVRLGVSTVMVRRYLVQALVACHGVLDDAGVAPA